MDQGRRENPQVTCKAEGWRREDCKNAEADPRCDGGESSYTRGIAAHAVMVIATAGPPSAAERNVRPRAPIAGYERSLMFVCFLLRSCFGTFVIIPGVL